MRVLFSYCRKVGIGVKVDDNRYLCNRCADNYLNAGYDVKRTGTNCDDGIGRMNTQSRTDGDATRALLAEGRGGDPTSFKLSER